MTRPSGSSLIEVLVALSLLSLAFTALAPLLQQAVWLRLQGERLLQAQLLLQTLSEQVLANAGAATGYVLSPGSTPAVSVDCRSGFCDGAALAQWQLAQALASLPGALLRIDCLDCGERSSLQAQLYWDPAGLRAPLDCGAPQSARACLQQRWSP